MICRKCGCLIERGAKTCMFCGEPAEAGKEDLITRAMGDVEGASCELPPLVPLAPLAPVPATREETITELRRLKKYFAQIDGTYDVLEDLWAKETAWKEPSLLHWLIGGGLGAALLYVLIGIHLPYAFLSLFFIVWGAITVMGYVRGGRSYEKGRLQYERDVRVLENEIRAYYNRADRCFLPLDYTGQAVLRELIEGLDSGMIVSFEDYRINH